VLAAIVAAAIYPAASMAGPLDLSVQGNADTNQLDNFFVAGNLGASKYRDATASNRPGYRDDLTRDSSVFQNLRFGWRWNGIVGPEIGYAYLGEGKREYLYPERIYSVEPAAFTLGVNGKYNFHDNWFLTAHAGGLRSHTNVACTTSFIPCERDRVVSLPGGPSVSNNSSHSGWYGGLGVGYDIASNVSLGLNYDDYTIKYNAADNPSSNINTKARRNIAAFSTSIEYRF